MTIDDLSLHNQHCALLVVDVQEKLLPAMPEADRVRLLASTELLIEAARLFGLSVHITEQYPRGLGPTAPSVMALLEPFTVRPSVTEKTVFSAAVPEQVASALSGFKRPRVIVVGMEAHVCVFQTVRDLLARGYTVHVPFDAVASREPAAKQTALSLLARAGAVITTSETIVFDLLGDAKNAHFKALSNRVKELPLTR